jgi:hypothetical protein
MEASEVISIGGVEESTRVRLTGRPRTPLGCLACADALAPPTAHPPQPGGSDHVIFISVDGLSAGLLRDLIGNDLAGDYAHFRRFGYEGAITFNAHSDDTHTVTLPNHTIMLTGRPVLQPVGQPNTVHHCYTND